MKLLFAGDVMLGRLVNDLLQRVGPDYPWGDTKTLFQTADWRCCNLECVISDRGTPWAKTPKAFHFRSDAKNVEVLRSARINSVSLANNHTLDFDEEAMFEMLKLLDGAGIQHAGAGHNQAEARRPAVSRAAKASIALIAFTDNEPQWEAGPRTAGVFYCPIDVRDERAATLFETVRAARKTADLLIVSAHWGPNWGYKPMAEHIRFGHALIDSGADIIFGHSCHVFQGVEFYKGRPIMYSAGDFIDDYAVDEVERNDQSFAFIVEIDNGATTRLLLHPTEIANCQARMAAGDRAEKIALRIAGLNRTLGTTARWHGQAGILELSGS